MVASSRHEHDKDARPLKALFVEGINFCRIIHAYSINI